MKIAASELPLHPSGAIYHLNLFPEEIADTIILVGDPGRVSKISKRFTAVDVRKENREMITHTGIYQGKRLSVLSTGMGTDNIDIALIELDALANIDLTTREIKDKKRTLTLIRIGTCGALQADIPIHAHIASAQGLGIDGVLHFYQHDEYLDTKLADAFAHHTHWNKLLPYPYCTSADTELLHRVGYDMTQGITISAPGFFGPQGRKVRAPLQYPDMNEKINSFTYQNWQITNMEMECSAIYGLSKILGHKALTVCLAIANRATKDFSKNYAEAMENLIDIVLERLTINN